MAHPMLAVADHDERAEQMFTRDLKFFINNDLNPSTRALGMAAETELGREANTFEDVDRVFDRLLDHDTFRVWLAMRRTQQEMMWSAVGSSVDRQLPELERRAAIGAAAEGSLTLDPNFVAPAYLVHMDTHLMPGGMTVDEGDGSIRQGAMMEAGGAIYQPAAATGVRKVQITSRVPAYLAQHYPDLQPRRILDMGCGVGRNSTQVAMAFPDAEVYALDVGPSVLRYAHARAENLGARVHFSLQNAEHTTFEDGFFDLVLSTAMFHETSEPSIPKIINEIHRLLRKGGVTVNDEVPHRYFEEDILGKLVSEWEAHFNNESAYKAAISADYAALFDKAGFADRQVGWLKMAPDADVDLTPVKPAAGFSMYMASARK